MTKKGPIQVRSENVSKKSNKRVITLRLTINDKEYDTIKLNTRQETFTGALEYILKQVA